jgi:ubiquinone/menaquinone biosynthesis C-methylase UbiE
MNYGYAGLESELNPLRLIAGDEAERYCVQLYHYAAAPIDLRDKDVVEVSCGRGGGSSYVKRYLNAKSVTGIDLSANQIEFCRRVHKVPGLRFVQGAAEDIPLPDECFDAIINIEASCLYQDTAKFFKEGILFVSGYRQVL